MSGDRLRELCAELLKGLDENRHPEVRYPGHLRIIMARARALLAEAQPQPVGTTDEEWDALKERLWDHYETRGYQGERFMYEGDFGTALDLARQELLARWGHPAPEPVSVAERLPTALPVPQEQADYTHNS